MMQKCVICSRTSEDRRTFKMLKNANVDIAIKIIETNSNQNLSDPMSRICVKGKGLSNTENKSEKGCLTALSNFQALSVQYISAYKKIKNMLKSQDVSPVISPAISPSKISPEISSSINEVSLAKVTIDLFGSKLIENISPKQSEKTDKESNAETNRELVSKIPQNMSNIRIKPLIQSNNSEIPQNMSSIRIKPLIQTKNSEIPQNMSSIKIKPLIQTKNPDIIICNEPVLQNNLHVQIKCEKGIESITNNQFVPNPPQSENCNDGIVDIDYQQCKMLNESNLLKPIRKSVITKISETKLPTRQFAENVKIVGSTGVSGNEGNTSVTAPPQKAYSESNKDIKSKAWDELSEGKYITCIKTLSTLKPFKKAHNLYIQTQVRKDFNNLRKTVPKDEKCTLSSIKKFSWSNHYEKMSKSSTIFKSALEGALLQTAK